MISQKTPAGELMLRETEEGILLERYEGRDLRLVLPSVCAIEPKAFFNNRYLQSVTILPGIRRIGDWAFSHCPHLREVSLPRGACRLGRGIFDEDRKLRRVLLMPEAKPAGEELSGEMLSDIKGYGSLLAACATVLDAPYLLSAEREDDAAWLSLWDRRLLAILDSDDAEGLTELVLCGEEDYGSKENSPEVFLQRKRWRKVRLCFLRLLYDKGLDPACRERLETYLREHTKGCPSEETWLFLKKERSDDMAYLQLFTELSCITEENFDACIADLSGNLPQMRAYLLRWQSDHLARHDPFAELSLL